MSTIKREWLACPPLVRPPVGSYTLRVLLHRYI